MFVRRGVRRSVKDVNRNTVPFDYNNAAGTTGHSTAPSPALQQQLCYPIFVPKCDMFETGCVGASIDPNRGPFSANSNAAGIRFHREANHAPSSVTAVMLPFGQQVNTSLAKKNWFFKTLKKHLGDQKIMFSDGGNHKTLYCSKNLCCHREIEGCQGEIEIFNF